jgi:AcrR family transcriptional regulator
MSGPQSRFPRAGGGSYRDPVAHEAVLRATLALLVEVGYTKLTVEGIAERSGVPKSTIYRWWKNKAYIVYEALAIMEPPAWRAPTGNFADDLTAVLLAMLDAYTTPEAMASGPGLVADFATDPAGWERLLLELLEPTAQRITDLFEHAREAGLVHTDVDVAAAVELLMSAILGYSLLWARFPSERPANAEVAARFARLLLGGVPLGAEALSPGDTRRRRPRSSSR